MNDSTDSTTTADVRPFAGFPKGAQGTVLIPELFFSALLPYIDDLAELRLTVACFWALQQREGEFRYLQQRDFEENAALLAAVGGREALLSGLARAIQRGTLLAARAQGESGAYYFMNTEKGRRAVEALTRGEWRPQDGTPLGMVADRPTIFALYEQNIGALTPMLSETLREAERTYPYEWIVEAVRAAVENNRRSWRYVEAILNRWLAEGKSGGTKARLGEELNPYLKHPYLGSAGDDEP